MKLQVLVENENNLTPLQYIEQHAMPWRNFMGATTKSIKYSEFKNEPLEPNNQFFMAIRKIKTLIKQFDHLTSLALERKRDLHENPGYWMLSWSEAIDSDNVEIMKFAKRFSAIVSNLLPTQVILSAKDPNNIKWGRVSVNTRRLGSLTNIVYINVGTK